MSEHLNDLCREYTKLLENVNIYGLRESNQMSDLISKVNIINSRIDELRSEVETLNVQLKTYSVELSESEREEIEQMKLVDKTLKVFGPYILLYQMLTKVIKNDK